MSNEALYENYLLNNPDGERAIEVFKISHSDISRDYWFCQELGGLSLGLNGGQIFAEGRNFSVTKNTTTDDLSFRFTITFSDVEGLIQDEAARIPIESSELIQVEYYVWMASDASEPAIGPVTLFANALTPVIGAVRVDASSPSLVDTRTGELYTYERFPTLLGFL